MDIREQLRFMNPLEMILNFYSEEMISAFAHLSSHQRELFLLDINSHLMFGVEQKILEFKNNVTDWYSLDVDMRYDTEKEWLDAEKI